jgi:hypothetical protein
MVTADLNDRMMVDNELAGADKFWKCWFFVIGRDV